MSATLASLRIRNLALVEELLWEPGGGFTAVTGETGAGKSVILGAVKLILGERADKTLIRTGADSCAVEGVFELEEASPVHALLEASGVEPCEEGRLLIRRTISAGGAGRQFANGSPCTLALLKQAGDLLLDLHGPHDHQSLFSREQQMALLDSFGGAREAVREFQSHRREWMRLVGEKERLAADSAAVAREIDLLTHQTREIEQAELSPGEEEPLIARQKAAANSRRLGELSGELASLLGDGEDSLVSRFTDVVRLTKEAARLDPQAGPLSESAAALFEGLRDLGRDIGRYAGGLELDPARLAEIEARLDAIQALKRKYGTTVEEVLAFGREASERLAGLVGREERSAGLDGEIERAGSAMKSAAAKLTRARRAAAPRLEALIKRHLGDLGFAKSGFSIHLEETPGPHGDELAEFLFSPNPGEPERALRAIASSGEISRVMLAVKTALAGQGGVPVLIFDEIDANVGGEIGAKVGAKMKELGQRHQVICITHLPQVAAQASAHYFVEKEAVGGRTTTRLALVEGCEREREVARMLGGKAGSAIAHARALLGGN